MRIAQVSPLFEAVPPRFYGGTERIVYNLTEALIEEGHEVTLFASGDSLTSAPLRSTLPQALRLSGNRDATTPHTVLFERIRRDLKDFDLIHFHTEHLHLGASRAMDVAHVSTMHGRLDLPEYQALFRHFYDVPLVSISEHQRRPLPFANWAGCVHHGLLGHELKFHAHEGEIFQPGLFEFSHGGPSTLSIASDPIRESRVARRPQEKYLAFLGRLSREKRVDRAIEIARRTGWKIKIAAKIEPENAGEYLAEIQDLLKEPHVEFVGEINEFQKDEFLGNASALLFPIDWPEPFGLVMIEALAVGTPVIAFANGSVPEVIRDGETGFVVRSVDEACEAVRNLAKLSRHICRREFEKRFTARRMALDYLRVYEELIERKRFDDQVTSKFGLFTPQLVDAIGRN